jgi:hypothetical protein
MSRDNFEVCMRFITIFFLAFIFSPKTLHAEESHLPRQEIRQEYFCPQDKSPKGSGCGYFPVQVKICRDGFWLAENGRCYPNEKRVPSRTHRAIKEALALVDSLVAQPSNKARISYEGRLSKLNPIQRNPASFSNDNIWGPDGF